MRTLSIEETLAVSGGGNSRTVTGWRCAPIRQRPSRRRLCLNPGSYEDRAKAKRALPG